MVVIFVIIYADIDDSMNGQQVSKIDLYRVIYF